MLKYPDILGLRLKEQSQLSQRKLSLLQSEREVLLQPSAKRLGGFFNILPLQDFAEERGM